MRLISSLGFRSWQVQSRSLSIHEYQSVQLLNSYGIPTPKSVPAFTAVEAESVAASFGKEGEAGLVIKAQVLAGGRGKGHFENGFQGGVQMVDSPSQAKEMADKMIGHKLITKQTGAGGRVCNAVSRMIEPFDDGGMYVGQRLVNDGYLSRRASALEWEDVWGWNPAGSISGGI